MRLLLLLLALVSAPATAQTFTFPSASGGRTLSVPAGTYTVASTATWANAARLEDDAKLVVPSGVTLTISGSLTFGPGASIEVQTGGTLTVASNVNADPTQHIFQGAGTVQLTSAEARPEIYGEWFGAVPNARSAAVANSTAFTKAFASLAVGGTVRLLNGYYYVDCVAGDAITVDGNSGYPKNLIGASRVGSILYINANCTNYIIKVDQSALGASFRDFSIYGSQLTEAAPDVTVGGLWCLRCTQATIRNIRTFKVGNPFTLNSFSYSSLSDIVATEHSGVIRLGGGTPNDNKVQAAFSPEVRDVVTLPQGGLGQSFIVDSGNADTSIIRLTGGGRSQRAFLVTNTSVEGAPPENVRISNLILDATSPGAFHISWGRNVEVHDSIIGTTLDPSGTLADATTNTNSPVVIDTGSKVVTSSITSGSATVTPTSLVGLAVGMPVTGTGIPAGTRISTVGASTITLSDAATVTDAAAALTYEGPPEQIDAFEISTSQIRGGGGSGVKIVKGCNIRLLGNKLYGNGANTTGSSGGVEIASICGLVEVQGNMSGIIGAPVGGANQMYANVGSGLYQQDYGVVIGAGADPAPYTNTWGAPGYGASPRHFKPRIFIHGNMLQGNVSGSILDNSTGWTAGCSGGANKCIANNMVD